MVDQNMQPTQTPIPNKNIRKKGEELQVGDVFLQKIKESMWVILH